MWLSAVTRYEAVELGEREEECGEDWPCVLVIISML